MLTFQRLSGPDLNQYIDELAQLRMRVFHDFPYLYDGDAEYEARYLKTYIDAPDSVIVLAFDGDKIVGASTGLPLRHETDEVNYILRKTVATGSSPHQLDPTPRSCHFCVKDIISGAGGQTEATVDTLVEQILEFR